MELHFIFMKYWTQITGTHYLIGVPKTWAFAMFCWWLPIYNLCRMSNTCSLQKQKRPPEKHSLHSAWGNKTKRTKHSHRLWTQVTGRSVTRFLVKGRESYIWKQKYFILLPWLFTILLTGNESRMSWRKDTSRNFAHKSFNTELRNVKHIFL